MVCGSDMSDANDFACFLKRGMAFIYCNIYWIKINTL